MVSFMKWFPWFIYFHSQFGKQWFKPEEASGLRAKIRKILVNEFRKPCEVDHISESFPLSTSEGNDSDWISIRCDQFIIKWMCNLCTAPMVDSSTLILTCISSAYQWQICFVKILFELVLYSLPTWSKFHCKKRCTQFVGVI